MVMARMMREIKTMVRIVMMFMAALVMALALLVANEG